MAELPMVFILAGLAAYTVLAGADFGAGLWTLLAGRGEAGHQAIRHHARHAMGPVWEANHVWLIYVSAFAGGLPVADHTPGLLTPVALAAGLGLCAVLGAYAHLAMSRRRNADAALRVGDP
ncbi:cytochrome d ubiquinol oxidase subunit II [Nonomuraea diastatica]|uniref:Cytochrome d ubiquinol oxidase subunit II n=1 Tax=Nonomuraea diastatica TaxID=1848329 RepID=A0A4R4WXX1_9ACTN|nr:cytochrome d ubiquinol oxidase subunit II [Nonomuraea diastatica]TDD22666.1 hypothetical protein E1294_10740 [Nonomuraea diastatica]